MKKIIISCPYNGLSKLEELIRSEIDSGDLLISERDIEAIDDEYVYLENNERHLIKSFTKSYIRYPYDLISPHSETYEKRENTEFLKTLAILFNHAAVNNFFKAHLSRNRIYSLNIAEECGFNVPKSLICKKYTNPRTIGKKITKSLGNCFYSEKLNNKKLKDILSFEEDDGEQAYIYKPHLIEKELDFKKHIDNFHTIFLQNEIRGDEFRAYLIGNKVRIALDPVC